MVIDAMAITHRGVGFETAHDQTTSMQLTHALRMRRVGWDGGVKEDTMDGTYGCDDETHLDNSSNSLSSGSISVVSMSWSKPVTSQREMS